MDIRKVKKLIELLEESGIAELEIKEGEESVRISRQSTSIVQTVAPAAAQLAPPSASTQSPEPRNESRSISNVLPLERLRAHSRSSFCTICRGIWDV